jgi:hypothetical protein
MKGRCAIREWINPKSCALTNHALLGLIRSKCKQRQNTGAIVRVLYQKPTRREACAKIEWTQHANLISPRRELMAFYPDPVSPHG